MNMKENKIKVGMEVMVNGIQWAIVEKITENGFLVDGIQWSIVEKITEKCFFVVDQDGGEMEVSASRIDVIG